MPLHALIVGLASPISWLQCDPLRTIAQFGLTINTIVTDANLAYTAGMIEHTYLVALKPPSWGIQHVVAASFAFYGDHLVFLDAQGKLAALFLTDLVQSWHVLPLNTLTHREPSSPQI